jgi:pyruvate/2-oxoglutarate dehydrogenase complex dihydrolipoamide dehydrogenase (E3) component
LVVLGRGCVGLVLAQAFRPFGNRVTIIEAGPQLVNREDPEFGAAIADILRDKGIIVHLGG